MNHSGLQPDEILRPQFVSAIVFQIVVENWGGCVGGGGHLHIVKFNSEVTCGFTYEGIL